MRFQKYPDTCGRDLSKGAQFEIKRMRTELGRQSLQFRGPIIWNSLNKELKKQAYRETFKRQLRSNMKALNKLSFGKEQLLTQIEMKILFIFRNIAPKCTFNFLTLG